jgi:hypothetical protein
LGGVGAEFILALGSAFPKPFPTLLLDSISTRRASDFAAPFFASFDSSFPADEQPASMQTLAIRDKVNKERSRDATVGKQVNVCAGSSFTGVLLRREYETERKTMKERSAPGKEVPRLTGTESIR